MSKYSEYSKLRSIARKRAERLAAAGLTESVSFPSVKQIKEQGLNLKSVMSGVQQYLSAPTTKRQYEKLEPVNRPVVVPTREGAVLTTKAHEKQERQKQLRRERNRRYRERVRSLTKQEKAYMKAAKTLGLHITPANAKAFGEYMDFRFAQGSDSVHYRIARYVEDYMAIIAKKGYSPDEILSDFNLFLSDRLALQVDAGNMTGITPEELDDLFDGYIDELDE